MKKELLHKSFKLNGVSFTSEKELLSYTKGFSGTIYGFLIDWFSLDEFVSVQTSGSTGVPKLITLQKEFMKNSAKATGDFFNLKENTTALLCLPVDYIAGKMMLVRALTLGWHIDVVAPISNPLKSAKKNYCFSAMVPLQLQNSIADLYKVKKLIVGGGVVSVDLQKELQKLRTEVYATYGMTETITHIAVKKLNNITVTSNSVDTLSLRDKDTYIGNRSTIVKSFYKVLPNVTIYKDVRNCLLIKAPKITKEFIITNDVVDLVSDTEFRWLGRYDNVINSGGIKLHPEKIEEKLSGIIKSRFFVAGVKDLSLGEKLVLLVEGAEEEFDLGLIKGLSKYEIPKSIYFVNKFIETETKKIQRLNTLDLLNI